jgi:hypothetical protein
MAKPENCDVLTHFASLGMGHTIDQPTRICEKSATLIDNIFTSDRCMSGFILQTDITDHMTLGICPKIGEKHETHKLSEKTYSAPLQDTRSLSYLRDYLKTAKWESVTSDLSVNAFTTFQSKIKEATSICCPLTEKTFKAKPIEPWYSLCLLNSKYTLSKPF